MFGGRDLNELFITSASFGWETEYASENHNYKLPKGGSVYRIKTDFQGKEEFKAAILI
jgi:sugar lactone lactonase YvrE